MIMLQKARHSSMHMIKNRSSWLVGTAVGCMCLLAIGAYMKSSHDDTVPVDALHQGVPMCVKWGLAGPIEKAAVGFRKTPKCTVWQPAAADMDAPVCSGVFRDPGCPVEEPMDEAEMNKLLMADTKVLRTEKTDTLLLDQWWLAEPNGPARQKRIDAVNEFFWNFTIGGQAGELQPPQRGTVAPKLDQCQVLFNPIYKFIYVKNTKVAGSSTKIGLGDLCPLNITLAEAKERAPCLWCPETVASLGPEAFGYSSWDEMWADYTVFATIRNVYDRAGSAYDYLLGRRKVRTGICRDPDFEAFTARPYVLGLQDQLYKCGGAEHDFAHVETQESCIRAPNGGFVTDHLVRQGNLNEDMATFLETVNAKRDPGLPPMNFTPVWVQRGPLSREEIRSQKNVQAVTDRSRHLDKFMACGRRCLSLIHEYYREDFELLGYPVGNISVPGF